MTIARFPKSQLYDSSREIVNFAAIVGDKTIVCAISIEALHDHFDGDIQKPTETFIGNRGAIEYITERLIARQRFEADGSIMIRAADC